MPREVAAQLEIKRTTLPLETVFFLNFPGGTDRLPGTGGNARLFDRAAHPGLSGFPGSLSVSLFPPRGMWFIVCMTGNLIFAGLP